MARRDKGSGSVYQRTDGRWVAQLTTHGVRRYAYSTTEREAKARLKELQQQAQQGTLRAVTHQTLADYLDWWLATAKPKLKPTTHEWYCTILSTHAIPTLGTTKLDRLSPMQCASLYAEKLMTLSPTSVRHVHNVLRKALNDAVRLDLIGANPCLKVDPPRPERVEPALWSDEDLRRFVASEQAKPTRWTSLWLTLLATGMRIGEALGLTWERVDLERGCLAVEQAIVFVDNKPVLTTPKSKTSRRVIAVPSIGIQALRRQRALQAEDKLRLGAEWPGGDFVFLTSTGHHPERGDLRKRLHEVCARAGLAPIRIHDLRHLSASLLVQGGADVKSVQKRLGHASLQTTLGIYAHVLGSSDLALAAALDTALGG